MQMILHNLLLVKILNKLHLCYHKFVIKFQNVKQVM